VLINGFVLCDFAWGCSVAAKGFHDRDLGSSVGDATHSTLKYKEKPVIFDDLRSSWLNRLMVFTVSQLMTDGF
jgi:hypothetical protein